MNVLLPPLFHPFYSPSLISLQNLKKEILVTALENRE